jgi:hypothetical protein
VFIKKIRKLFLLFFHVRPTVSASFNHAYLAYCSRLFKQGAPDIESFDPPVVAIIKLKCPPALEPVMIFQVVLHP